MKAIAVLLVTLTISSIHGQEIIRLNTHIQAPLTYLDGNDQPEGTAMRPVLRALREMGWEVEINFLPWARAQLLVKDGQSDGFFAASRNTERDNYAVRSGTIATQTINWYLLSDSEFDPHAGDFRQNARIGGYIGANMLAWLLENGYNVTGQPSHPDQLFLMLLFDRLDACLANNNNFENFLEAYPQYRGRFRVVNQTSNELYIYFSRNFISKNPGFLETFNKSIADNRFARPE